MKKRRHRAKSDILIDLTSLLDVIFIVLLLACALQWQQKNITENKEKEVESRLEQAADMEQDAEAKAKLYEDQREMADKINQYVFAVSVYATYNPENVTARKIRVLREGEEIETFDLRGTNVQDSIAAFREHLEGYVKEHQSQPVILSLNDDDEKILYRDEKAIKEVFDELKDAYDNVFVR